MLKQAQLKVIVGAAIISLSMSAVLFAVTPYTSVDFYANGLIGPACHTHIESQDPEDPYEPVAIDTYIFGPTGSLVAHSAIWDEYSAHNNLIATVTDPGEYRCLVQFYYRDGSHFEERYATRY